ncbi:MAG: glycosyltransferase family 1 protein [Bacteroidales bacterium]|nr:glycosyltransferase family 1 protein [Bacteroidales bacterium]MDD4216983.1 glycosyltransferase family 1 protein [Bacteroidales bacterium]
MATKKPIYINGHFMTQSMTGIQRFSYELCKAMINAGEEIIVLAPRKVRPEYQLNCKIIKFGVFNGVLWEHLELLILLLNKRKPLLLNFGSPGPLFYKNRIVTIHDVSFKKNPKWFAWYYSLYYRIITPIYAKRSHKIITVSEFSKSEIQKWLKISDDKFAIVHNAVSKEIKPEEQDTPIQKGKYILTVSSLDPRKNIVNIFKAFALNKNKDLQLILAGKKSSMFNFKENDEVKIKSIGYVSNSQLANLYKNAIAFIYLSYYEGFGIPPLEAMSFGCPVILSDIPVFKEIYNDSALFVNPDNLDEINNAINRIVNNERLRTNLISKGLKKSQEYTWEKSAKIICDIINKNH